MAEEDYSDQPQDYPSSYGDYADDYSDQYGDYSKEYDNQYGGYPQGYENQYRTSDADYASKSGHKQAKQAHNYRQNADDATWARWEGDVDKGTASKHTQNAVNQRKAGQDKVTAAAGDPNSPQYADITQDEAGTFDCFNNKKDCAGVCWGASTTDDFGGCCLDHEKDCAGTCFGDSIWINKNGTQYGTVVYTSSSEGDWKCCSRSQDKNCCQTQSCNGGCPDEGSGGKPVYKDGKMCMCNPKTDKGCCGDGSKDCRKRCPHEANFGEGCERYAVICSHKGNGYTCERHSQGTFITAQDCHWSVGAAHNSGKAWACID